MNEATNQQPTPTLGSNEPDINTMAFRWRLLKDAEDKAKADRIQCESDMLPFLEQRKEGATTTTLEDGTKITTEFHPIKLVEMLDETRLKFLLQNEPDTYKIISEAITTTPRKPNITVKKAEQS